MRNLRLRRRSIWLERWIGAQHGVAFLSIHSPLVNVSFPCVIIVLQREADLVEGVSRDQLSPGCGANWPCQAQNHLLRSHTEASESSPANWVSGITQWRRGGVRRSLLEDAGALRFWGASAKMPGSDRKNFHSNSRHVSQDLPPWILGNGGSYMTHF